MTDEEWLDRTVGIEYDDYGNPICRRTTHPLAWTENFIMTIEEAEQVSDPEWIIPNLIIRGHLIVIPAPPNGGKTTIIWHLCQEMVDKGFRVYYVNADISGGDAKHLVQEAYERGINLLLPDMKAGLSMNDVVNNITQMNEQAEDYSDYVFIFDTLKKMTDVINKTRSKELYKVLRGLTAKGMTVVTLAHTNKYNGEDGKPIFEGTGDMRSDFDELIYLIPQHNPDGSMTVSTDPDKVRGTFEPITFNISPEREVTLQSEYVDVTEYQRRKAQLERDEPTIEAIREAISKGKIKQVDIVADCKERKIGKNAVIKVLKRYSHGPDSKWKEESGFQNNTKIYTLRGTPRGQTENQRNQENRSR
ncbi:MAG: AAA family ATPase [Sedimenticola sp.]